MFSDHDPIPVDGITGILEAFATYPLVALGEAHWLQQGADFITRLLQHPDFSRAAQSIVVEFGNAYYQSVIDRFITGAAVTPGELHSVWRDVGGVGQAFESPIYAGFFHTVHAINRTRPADRQLRVLLGDPPVDTERGTRATTSWSEHNARDAHYAGGVGDQVLADGQRALLIAGAGHFARISDALPHEGNVVQRLELRYPGTVFVVIPHVIFDETVAERPDEVRQLDERLAAWPIPSMARVHGTWLAELDAYLHFDNLARIVEPDGTERMVRVPYIRPDGAPVTELRLSDMADALLYLGPQRTLTFTPP